MEKTSFIKTILICAFCGFMLFGVYCSQNGGRDDTGITLHFWQFWTDPQAKAVISALVEEFERENPGIKIEVNDLTWGEGHSKIVVAFASGNPPDILELGSDWIPEFSSRYVLRDIKGYIAEVKNERIMWEPAEFEHGCYAFPWFLDTRVIFYNKKLLNQAGFNDPPTDWDNFLKACQKINNIEGVSGFGANSFEKHRLYKKFMPFVWSNGGEIINKVAMPVFNSSKVLTSLDHYLKLVESGVIDNQRNLDTKFIDGKLGFNFSGGWLMKNINANNPALEYGVMPVPSPSGEMGISFAGGEYLSISSACKHPDEAFKFIEYLVDKDNTIKLCKTTGFGFPSSVELSDDPFYNENPHRMLFHKQLINSRMPPAIPQWVYIEEIIEKTIEQGMYKKGNIEHLLEKANDDIKRILDGERN
ncbi:MAG: extracellular solute-binding protein [candidate division Zixibacteria bacterium]|nr:extracellular solute-binding protein [candidate division Zixibacteria bacterium]